VPNYRKIAGNIPEGWVVHHIDCNRSNNNPQNLICIPELVHKVIHQFGNVEVEKERIIKLMFILLFLSDN
jgi:hypothetical protein